VENDDRRERGTRSQGKSEEKMTKLRIHPLEPTRTRALREGPTRRTMRRAPMATATRNDGKSAIGLPAGESAIEDHSGTPPGPAVPGFPTPGP
jgi:hypothetical protein